MTADLVTYYNGDKPGGTPGLLPLPYYCTWQILPFNYGTFLGCFLLGHIV